MWEVMTATEFPTQYIGWIRTRVSTAGFSVVINRGLEGFFKGEKYTAGRSHLSMFVPYCHGRVFLQFGRIKLLMVTSPSTQRVKLQILAMWLLQMSFLWCVVLISVYYYIERCPK